MQRFLTLNQMGHTVTIARYGVINAVLTAEMVCVDFCFYLMTGTSAKPRVSKIKLDER
jgi:hypothetical protein